MKNLMNELVRWGQRTLEKAALIAVVALAAWGAAARAQQVQANFATTNFFGRQTLTNNATVPLFPGIGVQTQQVLTNGAFGPPQTWRAVYAAFRIDLWNTTNDPGQRVVLFDHPVALTNVTLSSLISSVIFSNAAVGGNVLGGIGQTNAPGIIISPTDGPAFGSATSNGWFVLTGPLLEDFTQTYVGAWTNGPTPTTISWFVKARSTSP